MAYPEDDAYTTHRKWGITLSAVRNTALGHWCGYARFPVRPIITQQGYDGILTYVPVHGGITYAEQEGRSIVYGFDCAHAGDEIAGDLGDPNWIIQEARRMAKAIAVAAFFDIPYDLTGGWRWGRIQVILAYTWIMERLGISQDVTENFGIMINIICGRP